MHTHHCILASYHHTLPARKRLKSGAPQRDKLDKSHSRGETPGTIGGKFGTARLVTARPCIARKPVSYCPPGGVAVCWRPPDVGPSVHLHALLPASPAAVDNVPPI